MLINSIIKRHFVSSRIRIVSCMQTVSQKTLKYHCQLTKIYNFRIQVHKISFKRSISVKTSFTVFILLLAL